MHWNKQHNTNYNKDVDNVLGKSLMKSNYIFCFKVIASNSGIECTCTAANCYNCSEHKHGTAVHWTSPYSRNMNILLN